jgi:hypothetical protein
MRTVARASSRLATLAQQDDSEEQHRREPQVAANHRIVHPLERDAPARVGLGEFARESGGDGTQIGFRSLHRHA